MPAFIIVDVVLKTDWNCVFHGGVLPSYETAKTDENIGKNAPPISGPQ